MEVILQAVSGEDEFPQVRPGGHDRLRDPFQARGRQVQPLSACLRLGRLNSIYKYMYMTSTFIIYIHCSHTNTGIGPTNRTIVSLYSVMYIYVLTT